MRYFLFAAALLLAVETQALEYEVQLENDQVSVARVKILPHEEIGLHRDLLPQVVVALKGGTITRLEADGRTVDVNFPTGVPVYRKMDPPNEFHKSVNKSGEVIELIIIQLKEK